MAFAITFSLLSRDKVLITNLRAAGFTVSSGIRELWDIECHYRYTSVPLVTVTRLPAQLPPFISTLPGAAAREVKSDL